MAQRLQQLKQDQNELNKQVFALVAFGTFLPQDISTVGDAGGTPAADIVVNSLGDFATDQLSRIISNRLGGVEVQVELGQYQTTTYADGTAYGVETNRRLDIALSKRFLNDRMEVVVGTNYDFNQSRLGPRGSQSDIIGDIIVFYDITPSGNIQAKVFNKQEYDIFDETVENKIGAGLTYSIEFDRLFGTREEELPLPEDAPEDAKPEKKTVDDIINNPNPAWNKQPYSFHTAPLYGWKYIAAYCTI